MIPVVALGDQELELATSPARLRRLLADALDAGAPRMTGDYTFLLAVAAGLISFLSPCVLPLVPAYLGQLTAVAVAAQGTGRAAVPLGRGPPLRRVRRGLRQRVHAARGSRPRSRAASSPTTCPRCASSAAASSS